MALLTLKDIGKIYVSEGNVTVGIRGVNLSFDRGEFVAITGKSGSGKSTLLNVISGMDSYEEGELYIDGQTTSHYLQPEWEDYRQKYISFIFQDYNIIESFTVLQNVELALMHIEDKKERRRRALELLDRVGMTSHIRQKGSKLSGGQKQRTVIARALAKDSPIILADEPTGNLDSATSAEIIELLREVSKDKLLIVVTHNFEQVEQYATRHIRVFDGAVEFDHVRARPMPAAASVEKTEKKTHPKVIELKNGFTLGHHIFTAKPKLSIFLCFLMIIGTLGIFLMTSLCGEAAVVFEPHYMFEPIEGRVILTRQNGEVITDAELQTLMSEYGAEDYLHYDVLLDEALYNYVTFVQDGDHYSLNFNCTYGKDYGDRILGSYPSADNEVFLYLPISYQPVFGKDTLLKDEITWNAVKWKVTGVKYYYDNNKTPECLFTQNGFRVATAVHYITRQGSMEIVVKVSANNVLERFYYYSLTPSFEIEDGKIYIGSHDYQKLIAQNPNADYQTNIKITATYYNYNYFQNNSTKSMVFTKDFSNADLAQSGSDLPEEESWYYGGNPGVTVSTSLLSTMAEDLLVRSYRQASLFFENDKAAHEAAEKLNAAGYIAVPADTTYTPDISTTILSLLSGISMALVWLIAILFLAFFINLCSGRTLSAFKGDMAIMRSMGIPVKVIRVGMYVRMLFSLIPAYILVTVTAILIFTTPQFNEYFTYLYAWQYAVIFLGMMLLTVLITRKQIRKLFGESVKKTLKGGNAE